MFGASSFSGFGQQNQQGTNAPAQPAAGGMFGQTSTTPAFGSFGQTAAPATNAFGASQPSTFGQAASTPAQSTPFAFGQSGTASTFGQPKPASTFGAFGAPSTSTPAPATNTFGFGGATQPQPQQPAFGAQPSTAFGGAGTGGGSSFFGQPSTTAQPASFGGFGAAPLAGQAAAPAVTQGTATTPYQPFREDSNQTDPKTHAKVWDVHQSIASMPAYASMSPEELRLQDYRQGRSKGTGAPTATPAAGATPAFGFGAQPAQPAATPFGQQPTSTFGQTQPASGGLFGQQQPASTSAFGAQNNASSLFGGAKPATNAFGASNTGSTLFGQNTQQPSSGLFGSSTAQPAQPAQQSGFMFGQNNNAASQPSTSFSFGAGANNNAAQQNKPAFGFGSQPAQPAQPAQPPSSFSFGQNTSTQPSGGLFGNQASTNNNTSSSFSFGQNNNQAKPGGLFGSAAPASTTPSFGGFGANNSQPAQQNKPAFSFGGGGGGFGQTGSTPAPSTSAQPSTFGSNTGGGLFGAKPAQPAQPSGGFGFGQSASQPSQPSTFGANNASSGGGLFGAKPAQPAQPSGGLFGQSTSSAPSGGLFGQNNTTQPSGGLFGASSTAPKPSFSFGGSQPSSTAPSGGLFGQSQPAQPSGGLFGQSQPAQPSGGLFGTQTNTFGSSLAKPLGASAPAAPAPAPAASPASLTTNPYGTDALLANTQPSAATQAPLPFNVAPKSKPPLVSPFRSSPRNAVRVTRLRGSTPALDVSQARERTPFRESTPGLASRGATPVRSSSMLFRGPSDAQALSPQAFIPRSTSKRLVLDGDATFARSPSVRRETLTATPRARFSPAVERAADVGEESVSLPHPDLSVSRVSEPPRARQSLPRAPQPGDYVLTPALTELRGMDYEALASLADFSVKRVGFGEVAFLEPVDLASLPDLACIGGGVVQLRAKECFVYPQEEDLESETPLDGLQPGYVPVPKAALGHGLNVPARVSLEGCWPLDRATREPLKDPSHARVKQHITKLKNKKETEFVSYEPTSGTWTFIVQHFSRYGLDDSESESEDEVPAMQLGDEQHSESNESDLREEDLEGDEPDVWVPTVAQRPRSATPGRFESPAPSVARLASPAPSALPRKVQVMRASFFGHTPPRQGPAAGVSKSPSFVADVDAVDAKADVPDMEDVADEAGVADAADAADTPDEAIDTPFAAPIPVARVPLAQSVLDDGLFSRDAGLSFGRSFRIGCGPRDALVHNGLLHRTTLPGTSEVVLDRVRIGADPAEATQLAEALLAQQRSASTVTVADGVPFVRPKPGTSFQTHAQHYAADDKRYAAQFWHLGSALFDPLRDELPADAAPSLRAKVEQLRRKSALSQWLARAAAASVQTEARAHRAASRSTELIFALLSGFQVEHAADAALEANDVRLATLVAQAGGDAASKEYLATQLSVWQTEQVVPLLEPAMRRIYELLCGHLGTDAKVAAGLDWRRALGLHVWYGVPWEAPLAASVASYEAALRSLSDTQPPLPAYYDAAKLGALKLRELAQRPGVEWDAMYELVQLHVDPTYPLDHVLNARNFGASATEHTLPWHTYVTLARALDVRDFADAEHGARLSIAYAAQLESQGLWHWAAFVLLHIEAAHVRQAAVQALLERNVEHLAEHAAFLDALCIPATWRAGAEAIAAHAANNYYHEYVCWLRAESLSNAHEIAVTRLAPEAFVRGDAALLLDLFRPFGEAEQEARAAGKPFMIEGWNAAGRVLLDYATLPHILPPLLAKSEKGTLSPNEHHALQQATQRTHELIEAVPTLYPPSSPNLMTTVARSEMLVVLHNLARLIASHASAPEPTMHWTPAHPPEVEQLQAVASDFGAAMLATL